MARERQIGEDSIWSPAFVSICLINAMLNLSKQMSGSIVSKYVDSFGASAVVVGLVASAFSVAAIAFKLISEPALDTYNRKYILVFASIALAISFWGYSIADSVPMIVVFRFVQGAGQAFTATCLLTLATDCLPVNKMSTGVGIFALFEAASQAIGPTVGLYLVSIVGYKSTFAIGAALMMCSAFITLFYRLPFKRTRKFKISINSIISKEVLRFTLLTFIFNFCYCVITTFLIIFAAQQGVSENIGYYFTAYACTLMVSRPLVGRLADKFGTVKILIPAIGCFAISFWLISYATTLLAFLIAAFVSSFGFGASQPIVQALCMKRVSKERRGAASSTCYLANDCGNLLGSALSGMVVEAFGFAAMWRIMTIPLAIAIVYVWAIRRRINAVEAEAVLGTGS